MASSPVPVEALSPPELLLQYDINICAPMVRYSKRAFRATCAEYDVQWTTTPMIVAKEFSRSKIAREAEFSTSAQERGLFVPLADQGHGAGLGMQETSASYSRRRALVGKNSQWTAPWRNGRSLSADGQDDFYDQARHLRPRRFVRGVLVGQLAASDSLTLADGCEVLANHVDGLELNCGCPTSSAWSDHIGAYLLRKPELVADMVRTAKDRLGWSYPVCVKIRLDPELKRTETLIRNAIEAGASVLTIHGRTRNQSSASHPVDLEGIAFAIDVAKRCGSRTACASANTAYATHATASQESPRSDAAEVVSGLHDGGGGAGGPMPCVANGDVFTLTEAWQWRQRTQAQGVMSARGLLANPVCIKIGGKTLCKRISLMTRSSSPPLSAPRLQALFAGYDQTPTSAIQHFCRQALRGGGLPFQHFHRHIAYMLESTMQKSDSILFNSLSSTASVMDWLDQDSGLPDWKG
ncbi:tRNA dihydrouridine synthase [Tilletia horrida]|nr:tRNA dihydrouridine synthase [Tilletia horrida]